MADDLEEASAEPVHRHGWSSAGLMSQVRSRNNLSRSVNDLASLFNTATGRPQSRFGDDNNAGSGDATAFGERGGRSMYRPLPAEDAGEPKTTPDAKNSARQRQDWLDLYRMSSSSEAHIVLDPSSAAESAHSLSSFEMGLNVFTGGLGSSILTLPWGMAGAGVFAALSLTFVALSINLFTIVILVYAADRAQCFDLGTLLRELPGEKLPFFMQRLCNILLWGTMFLVLVG